MTATCTPAVSRKSWKARLTGLFGRSTADRGPTTAKARVHRTRVVHFHVRGRGITDPSPPGFARDGHRPARPGRATARTGCGGVDRRAHRAHAQYEAGDGRAASAPAAASDR